MASHTASSNKKSCCWLGHCCWLKMTFGLFVVLVLAGLYWKHMRIEREVSALSNQIKKGTPGQLQTQLDTVDLLVNMANVHLKTFGSKEAALSYLTQAKQQAMLLPESPEQRNLLQALADDTQTITAVAIMPLETVSKKLDALIEQSQGIEIAHIATNRVSPAPASPVNPKDAKLNAAGQAAGSQAQVAAASTAKQEQDKDWQEKLHEGWEQIKGLVKSEDKGASDNPVEAWLVPARLNLQLEEIKLAAFYRNNDFFHQLVGQTIDWIGDHYDVEKSEKVLALKNALEPMKNWKLTPEAGLLSKTLAAVENFRKRPVTLL